MDAAPPAGTEHGRIQQIVIDPEGEFRSLADELGYLYIEGHKLKGAALAEMARRARLNRISMVVDLSDCPARGADDGRGRHLPRPGRMPAGDVAPGARGRGRGPSLRPVGDAGPGIVGRPQGVDRGDGRSHEPRPQARPGRRAGDPATGAAQQVGRLGDPQLPDRHQHARPRREAGGRDHRLGHAEGLRPAPHAHAGRVRGHRTRLLAEPRGGE